MQSKLTQNLSIDATIIAGMSLSNQNDIEFFGIRLDKSVRFLQAGSVHMFKELPRKYFALLYNKYYEDEPAKAYFKKMEEESGSQIPIVKKVELYTYFLFGDLDHTPDIKDGILQRCENFRDTHECPSLKFSGKDIHIDGIKLTPRDLMIIDMSARECVDLEIAMELNISIQTLDYHKTRLFKKTGTQSKLGLVSKSFKNKVIS